MIKLRRCVIIGIVVVGGMISGCNTADQPKLAEAPPNPPQPATEPPKIPGQKKAFTQIDGYSKYMSKGGQAK
jgi:hypothetical protein